MAHTVTQVSGGLVSVDILGLSGVFWSCCWFICDSIVLGLRMVKESHIQLTLGMIERRKPSAYDNCMHGGSAY